MTSAGKEEKGRGFSVDKQTFCGREEKQEDFLLNALIAPVKQRQMSSREGSGLGEVLWRALA